MGLPPNRPVPPHFIGRDAMAALLNPLTELVASAGAAILAFNRGRLRIDGKSDGSPVTEADLAADRIIADGLARLAPHIPIVSEESSPPELASANTFFLIDPLDGTKEFVAGRPEFTVNLALVSDGTPILGIVAAPALGSIWRGVVGRGAERLTMKGGNERAEAIHTEAIHTRSLPGSGQSWIAAVSRSHGDPTTEAFIAQRPGAVRQMAGSAVKFVRVAEGTADIYPRLSPTREWDVAAGHALVTAAGGKITDAQGADLRFGAGTMDFIVPAFIAWGDPRAAP
ncbi:MAG TPA: 3'(2'),5'-bisphosphate nucleotidase CysQ [Bradyrhizobium sp.]|nr:3'(2'),5'-bisphosphate nucleotidase CysQ [Bradyrhizobium sp.]